MDTKKTGMLIFEARKKQNLTQKELADKICISDKAVSKWERGLSFPDISILIPLTEILKISLYELLNGENNAENDVEETLKNTIDFSNEKLKQKKKIYTLVCSLLIATILIIGSLSVFLIQRNKNTGAITDRDTIYDITHYSDYYTTIQNEDENNLDLILLNLPLTFGRNTYKAGKGTISINYGVSYSDIVNAYRDEVYVKRAMINNACVIFATVSDCKRVEISYTDYKFAINKENLQKAFGISSFDELKSEKLWKIFVVKNQIKNEFVNITFDSFSKSKIVNE